MDRVHLSPVTDGREERLRDLLVAAQGGDATAYAAFLRDMVAMLRPSFWRRLSQLPNDVEDLVQDTLLAVQTSATPTTLRSR
jgi:RNA polymerase sigma-70 factor (ECF subfamily)